MRQPDTPTPIGCAAGLFAIPFAIVAGLFFRGAYLAFTVTPARVEDGWRLVIWGGIFLWPAVLLIGFCVYRLWTTGDRKFERYNDSVCS